MRLINKLDGLDKGVSFRMRRTKTAFELPEGQWTSNNLPNWWKCKIGVIVWTLIANWVNFSFFTWKFKYGKEERQEWNPRVRDLPGT